MKDDKMSPDAFEKLMKDLGTTSDDLVALMILFKLNAKEFFMLSREEFVNGWKALRFELLFT